MYIKEHENTWYNKRTQQTQKELNNTKKEPDNTKKLQDNTKEEHITQIKLW